MKKIVTFQGSPRKKGNTAILMNETIRGAREAGAQIVEYDLNDDGIRGCQGCYACREHEGCSMRDYLTPMYEDIKTADAVVFGSPIYFYQITGQAKIWLDRMFPMIGGSEQFTARYPGKKFVTFFVQGEADETVNAEVIAKFHLYMKYFGWEKLDSILCCGTDEPDFVLHDDMKQRAYEAGKKLAQ